MNQKVAQIILQKMGCDVSIANSGEEALEKWKKEKFSLILMDVEMGGMSGLETAKLIRSQEEQSEEHIPIIALTGHALQQDRLVCMEAGMDGYVTKPINIHEVNDAIQKVLH